MAGIEQNPGPPKVVVVKYPCTSCGASAFRGSFQCSRCKLWVHSKRQCSKLDSIYNYSPARYTCPSCTPAASAAVSTATCTTQNFATPAHNNNNNNTNDNNPNNNDTIATGSAHAPSSNLRILQWNANGISNKCSELEVFLRQQKIDIAAIQETKLKKTTKNPKISGYRIIRVDRDAEYPGGGLAFLVRADLIVCDFQLPASSTDGVLESQAINITTSAGDIAIVNIYIPPSSSCPAGYIAPLSDILDLHHSIIVGDFNANHNLWHSVFNDTRGTLLANTIDESDLTILNDKTFTRQPTNAGQRPSSPDISLASPEIAMLVDWKCLVRLGSDHLPILLDLNATSNLIVTPRTTFVNFNKADWNVFKEVSEKLLGAPPPSTLTSVYRREQYLRSSLIKAAKIAIPMGRRKLYDPSLSDEVIRLITERDLLRQTDRTSTRIAELNDLIIKESNTEKTRKWRNFVEGIDRKTDVKKLWNTIKALDGKSRTTENTPITFDNNKLLTSSKAIANGFVKQFTTVRKHVSNSLSRRCSRAVLNKPLSKVTFSTAEITSAIKASKNSKAFGPDDLAMPYLKHLGPYGLLFLTDLINASFSTATIPDIWKSSNIIPLPKPGKDPKLAASYRPISLLSPVVKLLERLILPGITEHLPPVAHQHGFRPGHSTTTALLEVTNLVASGFNDKKPPRRSMIVALDLSKAFDSVDLDQLRMLLVKSDMPGWQVRWLSNYLRGRMATAHFRNATSSPRVCRTGVPQGSVISPALFNAYLRDLPTPPNPTKIVSYADDITVVTSGTNLDAMEHHLNTYLSVITPFLTERKLLISAAKSTITLLTPDPAQYSYIPNVSVNGSLLPLEKNPKILGVTLDPKLTFAAHSNKVLKKVQHKNQVLKALAGRAWGQSKETVLMTYKATSRAVLNYAAPVWTPILSKTNFSKLQYKQNDALRTATGCLCMTNIKHLHQETAVLPVQMHCRLLTDQFYAACRRDDHPCRHLFGCPGPPRTKKRTLAIYSNGRTQRTAALLPKAAPPKAIQQQLHKRAVRCSKRWIGHHPATNAPPLAINKSEAALPRLTRAHLAQLRSGFSNLLATTRHRIDKSGQTTNLCPHCHTAPEDLPHVFKCPMRQVGCNLVDLWLRPTVAAEKLQL